MIALPRPAAAGLVAQVVRASDLRQQQLIIYRQAIAEFTARPQWAAGSEVILKEGNLRGRPARFYLRNEGGRVSLFLYRQGVDLRSNLISQPFPIGLLAGKGWELLGDASEESYLTWNKTVNRAIDKQR